MEKAAKKVSILYIRLDQIGTRGINSVENIIYLVLLRRHFWIFRHIR